MSRIILIRTPSIFASSSYSAAVTLPLAQAYLAANLLKHGHEVRCIDALGEGLHHIGVSYNDRVHYRGLSNAQIIARMQNGAKPDAIGVTAMFSQDWPHIAALLEEIHARFPDVPIILGGEHASAASDFILKSCPAVKYVGVGEGDEMIVEFADFIAGKTRVEDVGSLHYLGPGGEVVKNPRRQRIKTPDDLPWPAWHLFDLEPYFAFGEGYGVERGRGIPILATRGCPYQCTFCSSPQMWTTRYFMRDASLVVDEIEHYMKVYRVENIDFMDLTAVVRKEWILSFCAEVKKRGLKFTWQLPSGTRSEALDDEVLAAMASSGCMNVTYAPESGSPETLKRIKKRVALPKIVESIKAAKKHGIFVKCNLIIGFPDESRLDVLKTVWFAIRLAFMGVEDAGLYAFSPYPGSEISKELKARGKIPAMNMEYFESLMAFMNLLQPVSYCDKVGPRELVVYRTVGMSLFYGLGFLLHPRRILRAIRNYKAHRSDTGFEERFFGYLRRRRAGKNSAAVSDEEQFLPAGQVDSRVMSHTKGP